MVRASIVASLTIAPSPDGRELRAIAQAAEWLEVRADLIGDLDPHWIRSFFPGRILYSLRSCSSGGTFEGSEDERAARILRASQDYDMVELDAEIDLRTNLLAGIAVERRMISWYGHPANYSEMAACFNRLSSVQSKLYKMVVESKRSGDVLDPLCLMKSLRRPDLIAFASGESGFWSRLIALQLGAPMIFGSAGRSWSIDGDPSVFRLIEDYGLPSFSSVNEIYGIVGNPIIHSLSPRIHNAAYRILGHPALFVPFQVESFEDFWCEVVMGGKLEFLGLPIKGLTVSSPYKEAALREAQVGSQMSRRVCAANVLVRENGHWKADTTDPEVVMLGICKQGFSLKGKKAAIVGCGGAGRAIAAELQQAGADVTLVNRGLERGRMAAALLGLPCVPLSSFTIKDFSILVNATPVGRDDNKIPFDLKELHEDAIVVDLVYASKTTPLVESVLALGRAAVDGQEVLLIQVRNQFHKMTGRAMPADVAYKVLGWDRNLLTLIQTARFSTN